MKCFGIFLLVLMTFLSHAQQDSSGLTKQGCSRFMNGQFAYVNEKLDTIVIIRKGNRQEERNLQTGTVVRSKITWTDSCAYTLTQIWSNSKAERKNNKSQTNVRITGTYPNRYDFTCACKDPADKERYSGTIVQLKQQSQY